MQSNTTLTLSHSFEHLLSAKVLGVNKTEKALVLTELRGQGRETYQTISGTGQPKYDCNVTRGLEEEGGVLEENIVVRPL